MYTKFLLIPVVLVLIVIGYSSFMNSLAYKAETTVRGDSNAEKSASGEVIGVGQAISVKITRAKLSYFFGLVQLPSYIEGAGNISALHTVFFILLAVGVIILSTVFVIIERGNMQILNILGSRQSSKATWQGSSKPNVWIKLAKSIGIGILFALGAFILSNDTSSLALGVLVAYLEFRLFQ